MVTIPGRHFLKGNTDEKKSGQNGNICTYSKGCIYSIVTGKRKKPTITN